MANNSNHIMSRYGKWITNKQKERLRKLYKGYRQSTAGDMRSQYLNARKGMYGVRTTASAYGLGEGYVARKKAQMDSSLAEAGRQYAAQADAAFENNAVRPAANATIQAENERKQREYEEKLRKAREKAAKQAKAQADYEKALEEYNRNKDKTDKENAKRLAEYKKAMAKYRKELKNAKQRGEKLDRLPQRQVLHGGQPLPKGLSLSADLHQYEGATSTPKPLKPLPKGKGKGKGKGRGGLLSTDMYEYESGTGHQPTATSHQGLNNRPVAPKTNYAANQAAVQKRQKAKEAVVGKPTKPILAITDTPVPVPPHIEKDLVAKVEAVKPEEIPQLKADYINSAVEHENLVGDLYNALKPDMNRVGLAQEFNHWVGVAQNTALSPAERKQAAMYASRAAEEYNLQDNGKAHKERVAMLTQMVNDSHDQLTQMQYILQQKGVRMSEDEIGFDTGYLRQYGAIPAQANDATYAQAQALGDKNSDLGKQLRELTKMEYLHSQGLPSGQLSPQMQAFIEENNLGWLIDQEVLDRAPLVGIETAIEEKLKKGGDERTEYLQRKGIDRVQRELSTSNPEAIKRVIGSGDSITHLKKLSQTDVSLATIQAMATGGGHQGKTGNEIIKELEKNLDLPSGYISFNTLAALKQDDASVAFINYCYATGQADLAKQYIFDLTEAANKAAGEKQADKISDYLPKGWKWIPEFMYHLGYGASNAIWGKIDFFRGKTPTRTGAYTQEGIIQNEIERGWSEDKARNWANALTSAGENVTDLGIGMLAGNVLGAAGDAIGGTVGNIVGKVAGHAPAISMGWSAAGSAKQEMLKKGYSEKAATIYGIFSGVSEAVLQEQVGGLVGFGDRGAFTKALSGLVNQIPNAAGRTAINAVLDIASEIGQEEFGNILDSVYRSVALGEGNDVYDDFKEQFNETAVTTAISTLLLNALHIPTQIRNERGYSAIADASGMSLNDAKFLLETDAAINGGERVDPNDILRYNELTANLMASMPDNVVKAINEGKMTVADWVTSNEGVVQGKLTGKLTEADTKTEAAKNPVTGAEIKTVDHTEALKGKTDEQRRDYLLNAAPTGKVGSAYYTTTNGKAIQFRNLNTTQKANYVLAQKCAKAFEGSVDVVIHDTLPLSNGAMVGSDGKLHIALDVTDNKGRESIAYWTLAHEAGHALKIADGKAWNEMFDVLTDYAKNHKDRDGKSLYDALVDSITNQYKYDNNSDAFNDEMFSLIAERMVGTEGEQWAATLGDNTIFDAIANDKNASAKAKRGFFGKMKNAVEKLSRQFRDGGFSKERKRLAKIREQLTEAYKRINEAPSIRDAAVARKVERKAHEEARKLREQTERREGFREGLKAHDAEFNKQKEAREKKARDDALLEEILKGFEEEDRIKASEMTSNMSEDGEVIGDLEIDNDGNVNRFSIRTTPQTEEEWDSLVNDMVAAGYTEEQAKAWIDDMRSVAAMIMDAQEFLDYENDPRSSWFRKNAEYTQGTIDFSNNCPRRAEFTAQFDALMKQFPNFAFTAEDYETIRTIIKDAGIAVTCGGCYVEERRQHLSEIGQLFLDKYHAALNGETGDNALAKKFFDKISEEDRKYDITLDDIVSSDSLRKLYDEHPTLYRAFNNFNNARGMAAARLVYGLSEYNNQIKKWNKGTITRKNNLGGLRIFSYSDADPRIILDVMQIITDSASKGLMMQGYTKKPWFAVFMKDTGVRLLRSHIPMGTGYKMVKGQMVLDFDNFEGINTKDKYYSMLDRDADLNIGNNVIGINDTQIRLAMVSDIIDQIIPFHTGLKKSILHQKKLEGWNNYRDYQTDKAWTAGDNGEYKWRTVKKGGINLYTDIINAIDWSKTETHADGSEMTDAERFVNKYLDICKEKGFKPRFAQFLCDENGNELSDYGDDHFYIEEDGKKVANPDAWYTYNPGYEKFLVDFRLFDKNGKIIEQNAVAPNFDNEFVKSLFSEYIKENPQAKPMDKNVQTKIVDAMKEKYGDELTPTRHSLRATDAEYLSLAEKYRDGTATEEEKAELEKRVEEAAKEAGYTIKAYHGTPNINTENNPRYIDAIRELYNIVYGKVLPAPEEYGTKSYKDFWAFAGIVSQPRIYRRMADSYTIPANVAHLVKEGPTRQFTKFDAGKFGSSAASREKLKGFYFTPDESAAQIFRNKYEIDQWTETIRKVNVGNGFVYSVYLNPKDITSRTAHNGKQKFEELVVTDPSQIKSADPVTYDDNGDIIPLSERFRTDREGDEAWKNVDIRHQIRKASDLYHNEHDFSEPITTDEFRKLIAEENDTKRYFPKGLPKEFLKTISRKSLFTAPKLYRGIEAAEFDYLVDNGYLKSNGSYNFANQQGQTLADEDAGYALSYATGFAPKPIADKHYRGDMLPTYLIEFINSPDLRMTKNQSQESYTEGKIDQKYITRVFEINYDPNTKKDMIHDITGDASTRSMLPNMGEGLSGYAHGEPAFFRDPNTGTILYAVQDEYGRESGRYVSEKMPDVTFGIGDTAAFNEAGMEQYFGVTVADDTELERMKVDEDGNLVPASDSPRYQQRDFRIDFNVPQLDTKALHEAVKGGEGTVENRFEVKYEKTDSGFAVHITDKDSGKTYDRAETVTEGNAKAEAERAAAAVIRNIKRGRPDSTSKSTAGIYHEKGEIPARDVNIPVSVKEGMRTSKLARTIAEASGMTEESVDELMDRVYDGFMSYKPDVNQESMDKALAKVEDDMAGAVTEWNEVVNKGKILSPDDVALGSALMVSASQSGNINEAMEIAAQLQDLATTGGKLVQSFRMIKRLGAAGAFYYINRQVAKINAELKKAAKGYKIEINQDLVNQLLAATDYHDIRDITEEIRKDLGHQLKPTLKDWLTAWRYTAMLGNLRTLDRNLLGNAGFIPIVMMKNVVNVGLQGAAKVLSGGKFQKTARLFASKQYTDFAKWDWNDQVKYDIKGNKYNDEANEIKQYMRYDTGAKGVLKIPAKVFNAWRSATTHAMEDERLLGDMAFKKAHYDYSLATRLQQQKVNTEMLKDVLARSRNGEVFKADSEEARLLDIYNKASEYAQQEANRNTYNDINAFARFISQMSKRAKESNNKVVRAAHYAIEGILPFKNTPANIISRAVEYSPIGIARTIAFDIGRLAKGRISGEQFIENLAKGITGSGLFALGAILAKSGILRGALGYDDDEDKDLKRKGHQSYSIEIFDKSITLDWLAPECIPLFMGVEFFNQMGDMSKDVWNEKGLKALLNVTTGAFEPMLNMSMLQGVNALFEGFKSKDDLAGLSKAFATIGTSYLTQFEPTLFGQFARTLDPYRRSTYIDKNSKLPPFISKFWQTAIKKIPGATDTLLPYVNEWGEKEKTPQWWVRALENFLSPAYINDLTETDVDREISRLFESTAETGAFPDSANKYVNYNGERYDLTQKEYEQYAVMRGETAYALAQEMIGTQWYNGLSDVEKVAAFADAYAYADTIASSAILDGRLGANAPDLETLAKNKNRSWVSKANVFAKTMGTPDALSQFIALRQTMAGMTGGRDARAEYLNGINELSSEAKALLMGMYDTSEGYAEGTAFYNKNGKLVIDFANPGEAAPAEQTTAPAEDAAAPVTVPAPTTAPAAQPTAEATAQPKSDKYTKAAEKWAPYGVTQTQAKSAVEKWDALKGSYEDSRAVSEYRTWLTKQNLTGRQRFAMYSQANADLEKKATEFNKKYGTKYEALWNAYTKYNGESFHGEEYRSWVEKQTSDYYQRFALVEFAEPRSNWIEHAEELHKAGVSYKAVWEAARYAKNQSGQGKKDRIIANAKKLGMTSKQAENIYKWFG